MTRSFLTDEQRADIVAACEFAGIGPLVAIEIHALAEEHAARGQLLDMFKAGHVTATLGDDGELRWNMTADRRAEVERAIAKADEIIAAAEEASKP